MSDLALRPANPPLPVWRCQNCGYWEKRYERQVFDPACPWCSFTAYGHRKKKPIRMWPAYRVAPREEDLQ